jgi:hypothetical protein
MVTSILITLATFVAHPSGLQVEPNVPATYHSVQWFDNRSNITNRVLDRSIVSDIVKVQPIDNSSWDSLGQDQKDARERQMLIRQTRNLQAVSTHCQLRLKADGVPNAAGECGSGFQR